MQGERREARAKGGSVFDAVNEMVQGVQPADSDVLFLPFLYGSNVGPKASAGFLGLHGWHGKAHMLRAVFEGVVFSHKTHIDRLLGYRPDAHAARIAGGAAKSGAWVQMFADVLQLPIELTACEELGAMGAAMCGGVGVGIFGSFEEAAAQHGESVPHRGAAGSQSAGLRRTSTGATAGTSKHSAPPGEPMDDLQLIVSVARMYYQQGMKQEEIARRVKVSRASISLILAEARRSGIVEITIRNPLEDNAELSRALCAQFGLARCVVVPTSIRDTDILIDLTASRAAEVFDEEAKSGDTVGVAWGQDVPRIHVPLHWPAGSCTACRSSRSSAEATGTWSDTSSTRWCACSPRSCRPRRPSSMPPPWPRPPRTTSCTWEARR